MTYSDFLLEPASPLIDKLTRETKSDCCRQECVEMLNHFTLSYMISTGAVKVRAVLPPERIAFHKVRFFSKQKHITQVLPQNLLEQSIMEKPVFPTDYKKALALYKRARQDFDAYFRANPMAKSCHPYFGYLCYEEWVQFHARHIRHHLVQLSCLESLPGFYYE